MFAAKAPFPNPNRSVLVTALLEVWQRESSLLAQLDGWLLTYNRSLHLVDDSAAADVRRHATHALAQLKSRIFDLGRAVTRLAFIHDSGNSTKRDDGIRALQAMYGNATQLQQRVRAIEDFAYAQNDFATAVAVRALHDSIEARIELLRQAFATGLQGVKQHLAVVAA